MSDVQFTHIGGPTVLIEVAGWRILTDPTFDPPGRRYSFGWGTASTKQAGPAVDPAEVPPVDAVLVTHHHHADNLDDLGTAMLPTAVIGTRWVHFGKTIRIVIGEPVAYDAFPRGHAGARAMTAEVETRLRAMIEGVTDGPRPGRFGAWLSEAFNERPWLDDPDWTGRS